MMPDPLLVNSDILSRACAETMARLGNHTASVSLEGRAYWFVVGEEAYDFAKVPSELGVGDLGEDWERVLALASGEEVPLSLALESLAAVLRAVSDADVP